MTIHCTTTFDGTCSNLMVGWGSTMQSLTY